MCRVCAVLRLSVLCAVRYAVSFLQATVGQVLSAAKQQAQHMWEERAASTAPMGAAAE